MLWIAFLFQGCVKLLYMRHFNLVDSSSLWIMGQSAKHGYMYHVMPTCACHFDVDALTLASAVCAAFLLPTTQMIALAHSMLVEQGASHSETQP